MSDKKESELERLKKKYKIIQEKYSLPKFQIMNEDFHIEKISEMETEILIREVRKFVGDKLVNYMRFLENLLNPVNVPMFIFSIVKVIGPDEKKRIRDIYKELVKNEVKFIELDLEFSEEKEAEFIKESYKLWQEVKKDLADIIEKINKKWSEEKIEINNKGYFG